MYSPASTKSSSVSKPTCGWDPPSKEGARAWIVGARGTKEITARANSNRMAAPTSVIIDCFVCILFISFSLLQACLSVSVQPSRSELSFLPRSEQHLPIGRAVGTKCSAFFILFWRGFLYLFPHSLRVHVAGKTRAKLGWKAQFLVMPNAMIQRRARFCAGWDTDNRKAPPAMAPTGPCGGDSLNKKSEMACRVERIASCRFSSAGRRLLAVGLWRGCGWACARHSPGDLCQRAGGDLRQAAGDPDRGVHADDLDL